MAIKELNLNGVIDNQIGELKEIIIKMNQLNKIDNKFSDDDVKESKKLGTRFNKLFEKLLSSEEGTLALINLMDDENPIVSFIAARNLYPLFPSRAMSIMENYLKNVNDKLEKMRVQDVIFGFESRQDVFMQQFKKLYKCNDIDSLNREKEL